ncbi:MAG: hypothetical protein HC923_11925, partial [Myxococcales bacterium]|nr:hypothetical protein [Myxococcales bacterium]
PRCTTASPSSRARTDTKVLCAHEYTLDNLRFVCDVHLGRLAAYLRMLGLDTRYSNDQDDPELAEIARAEGRVLLTRDVGLLKRSTVVYGAFVRATDPDGDPLTYAFRFEDSALPRQVGSGA